MNNHTTAAIANQGEAKTTTRSKKTAKAKSNVDSSRKEIIVPTGNPATPAASEKAKACPPSSLSPKEVQDRLQRAARILATGAIRAARQKALEASAKSKTTKASSALAVSAA